MEIIFPCEFYFIFLWMLLQSGVRLESSLLSTKTLWRNYSKTIYKLKEFIMRLDKEYAYSKKSKRLSSSQNF